MTLSITAVAPSGPVPATTLADVLTPGTVVDARVLKLLDANLVRLAIASLTLDVMTETPLQPGQTLQLAVSQTPQGLVLSIANAAVPTSAELVAVPRATSAARPNLPSAQADAVRSVVRDAATRQNSLAPLFANLDVAVATGKLPAQLQPVAAEILALRPRLGPDLSGPDVKAAFKASGLFREASIASPAPDLKAALIVLRQTLATFLTSPETHESAGVALPPPSSSDGASPETAAATSAAASPSRQTMIAQPTAPSLVALPGEETATPVSANALRASPAGRTATPPDVVELLHAVAQGSDLATRDLPSETLLGLLQLASKAQPARIANTDHAVTQTPPPPFRGALPSAQPIASPSIAPDASRGAIVEHLLDGADSAIARQTLLQVASLPDRTDIGPARLDNAQPRWAFEIPFSTPQGTAVAQFEISKDGGNETETSATSRVWRARFSLDVEPAGPVHALISLSGDKTSVRLWAERPATAARLRSNAGELGEALGRADIIAGDIVIRQGAPTTATIAPAGHFLDRAT